MLLVVVILLVAFILIPFIELTLNQRVQFGVKIAVYGLALLYILWVLFTGRAL